MAGGLADIDEQALDGIVIAYEPVVGDWDRTHGVARSGPAGSRSSSQLAVEPLQSGRERERTDFVRRQRETDNAQELLSQPDVDGALVGGASLKSASFIPIIQAGAGAAG